MHKARAYFHFLAGGIHVALPAQELASVHAVEDVASSAVDADAAPQYYDLATFFSENAHPRYVLQTCGHGATAYITADAVVGMESVAAEQQYAMPHILKFGANAVLDALVLNGEGRLIYILDQTRLDAIRNRDASCRYGMVFPECRDDACEFMYISHAGMHYAIPLSRICAVLTEFFVSRLPAPCDNVAGLMVYKNVMLPVFSSAPDAREAELVLIIENEGQYVGLCAEKIWEQTAVPPAVLAQCAYPDITQFHMTTLSRDQL